MKTNRTIVIISLFIIGLAGLAVSREKIHPPADPKPAETKRIAIVSSSPTNASTADYPIIGHIEKRDRTITIKAGPKGPVYTIKNADAKIVYENISAEQLRAQAPELHEFIKGAFAGGSGTSDARVLAKIDAAMR